jgi:prephenate dehydratase
VTTAYFGPPGTFTEEALLTQPDLAAGKRVPYASVPEVIGAVEAGEATGGVVPIENMIEGSVSVTLDTLAFDSELLIQREIDLPVTLNLCARPGVKLGDIETVVSFPHALAQCRGWMAKKLPGAQTRASHSTSDAAREVSKSKRTDIAATFSRPTSRIIPRTKRVSCSSGAVFPRRAVTTKRRSCAFSVRTVRVRCSRSSKSSRRGRST